MLKNNNNPNLRLFIVLIKLKWYNWKDYTDRSMIIMKLGYVRVFSLDQNDARQLEKMKEYNIDKIFSEKISGKNVQERLQLKEMIRFAKRGDTVYVHDFSRLTRSTKDLLNIVEKLNRKRVHLVSFKENIDSSTPTGKLMLTMIAAINEFERLNILERQKEGISIARKDGKYSGRKMLPFPEGWEDIYEDWKRGTIIAKKAWEQLNLKKSTFYKMVKRWEIGEF